jgi:hypothetical protein
MEKTRSKVAHIVQKFSGEPAPALKTPVLKPHTSSSQLLRNLRASRDLRSTQKQYQELEDKNHDLTLEVRARDSKIRLLETLQNETEAALKHSQKEVALLKARLAEYQKVETQRLQSEEHLRQYAQHLAQTKNDLATSWKELAQELSQAATLHPLKDLLKFTRKEIVRVEEILKRTPTLAAERSALERRASQLIEQREYLELVVRASEAEMQRHADKAQKQAVSIENHGVPPPPRGPERIKG